MFVSMRRNIGIPARVVAGYFLEMDGLFLKIQKNIMSLWIYMLGRILENGYWCPVDINIAQQTKNYFRTFPDKIFDRKDRRIIVSKGSNFLIENIKLDYL